MTQILHSLLFFLLLFIHHSNALGVNWGTRSSHPLPPDIVVQLLKDNGFDKVKLFEAEPWVLKALGRSGIQVMLGIPNEFLAPLARSVSNAEQWVMQNVSAFVSKYGVDIRYVAVGNEPFLKTYKGMFQQTTLPALQNIEAALIKAGLGRQVKVTIPLNADVYESTNDLPSSGNFRPDILPLMLQIIRFLEQNGAPLTINIYPFLSLNADPHFPVEYAFFSGTSKPVVDGPISYTNVFDANYDTLISALEKNGFQNLPVIVGEIGWPTDGDISANSEYAEKFNQGLLNRIIQQKGTPKRPNSPPDVYFFGLLDEDVKSIQPGNFERHWGIFNYDGSVKYPLVVGNGKNLAPAKRVRYLDRQWCVLLPGVSVTDPRISKNVDYACTYADCTCLGYGASCNGLDVRSNASYAFYQLFQFTNQQRDACKFDNLSMITRTDPSVGKCKFEIMIDVGTHDKNVTTSSGRSVQIVDIGSVVVVGFAWMIFVFCG